MLTVALPSAVNANPVSEELNDWENADGTPAGWGADAYAPPEPNVGDPGASGFAKADFDASKTWQDAPTLAVLDGEFGDGDGKVDADEERIYYDLVQDTNQGNSVPHIASDNHDVDVRSYPSTSWFAHLGFWRDCNGDGFMGDLDTMAMQYPAVPDNAQQAENAAGGEVTVTYDETLCPPPQSSHSTRDRFFNDGTQVTEFVPIGPGVRDITEDLVLDDDELQSQNLCPDRNDGPTNNGTGVKPGAEGTPRADANSFAINGNGDNIACLGARVDWVQDDNARLWMDLLYPTSRAKPTGSFCIGACYDGTYRDTNGIFRAVDGQVLGMISSSTPLGLWPSHSPETGSASAISQEDQDPGNQCEKHGDPVFGPDSSDPTHLNPTGQDTSHSNYDSSNPDSTYADNGNALSNALAYAAEVQEFANDPSDVPDCSPVPNYAYVTAPVLGPVAWPGHLVEDRVNSSEEAGEMGGPNDGILGEPFQWSPDRQGHCSLQDPDDWDGQADGDPVGGYDSSGSPTDFSKFYGPTDDGPSVSPTWRSVLSGARYQVLHTAWEETGENNSPAFDSEPECTSQGGLATLEIHQTAGQGAGLYGQGVEDPGGFWSPGVNFNPARSLGVGPDTSICKRHLEGLGAISFLGGGSAHHLKRCSGFWMYATFIDVPNEQPLVRSFARTDSGVGYADISFGDGTGRLNLDANGDTECCLTPGPHDSNSVSRFDAAGVTSTDHIDNGNGIFDRSIGGVYDASNPPGWDNNPAWTVQLLGSNPDAVLPGGNDAHTYADEGCQSTDGTGGFGQNVKLKEVDSTPAVYDPANDKVLADTEYSEDSFTLPTSGEEYTGAVSSLSDPSSSFWDCDRSSWLVRAGVAVQVQDANDVGGTGLAPGCNLWEWSDADGDGALDKKDQSTGNVQEVKPVNNQNCWNVAKPGDLYDIRDVECYDNDIGGDTYTAIDNNVPQPAKGEVFGTMDENKYFDCETTVGSPAP